MSEFLELKPSRGTRIAYRAGISEFLLFVYGMKHLPKAHYSPEEAARNEALSSRCTWFHNPRQVRIMLSSEGMPSS